MYMMRMTATVSAMLFDISEYALVQLLWHSNMRRYCRSDRRGHILYSCSDASAIWQGRYVSIYPYAGNAI